MLELAATIIVLYITYWLVVALCYWAQVLIESIAYGLMVTRKHNKAERMRMHR